MGDQSNPSKLKESLEGLEYDLESYIILLNCFQQYEMDEACAAGMSLLPWHLKSRNIFSMINHWLCYLLLSKT